MRMNGKVLKRFARDYQVRSGNYWAWKEFWMDKEIEEEKGPESFVIVEIWPPVNSQKFYIIK